MDRKSSAAGWLEYGAGRQETWKVRGELGPSFLPGLASQLLPYCPVAPLPVL